MAALAAQCRDPVRRKVLRKKAQRARREFEAKVGALPRGKIIRRPVVTKLLVNGRATEDIEEWKEEVKMHCEKCYDDKMETREVQAERIRIQRCRGDFAAADQGRQVSITVNRVLRARGKRLNGKSNGPVDCLVAEMLRRLPIAVIYEVAHWFQRRFRGISRAPEAWRILRLVFLKKPDAKLEKGTRGFRAIPLSSVFSKWYTAVLVDLLHEEQEPLEWMELHLGAERGVNCEYMQVLSTDLLQKHWEWQANRRKDWEPGQFKYKTMYMASLDVKTAFDVARPSVVSKILSLIGTHGHVVAALLAEMQNVRGLACFENCETDFCYSKCIRQGGVEASILWGRVVKYVLWKIEEKWKARGWGLSFGGEDDNEYVLRSMMWADNYWLFCHDREVLVHMVNDVIEELMDLDMEPIPESLWWTCSYEEEEEHTLEVSGRGKVWSLPFKDIFVILGYCFNRDGKGTQGIDMTLRKGMGSGWRDVYIYRSRIVPLKIKCQRVISHVFSTVLNGSVNWNWTVAMAR